MCRNRLFPPCSMHVGSRCEGLNKEHSICVFWEPSSLEHLSVCPNEPKLQLNNQKATWFSSTSKRLCKPTLTYGISVSVARTTFKITLGTKVNASSACWPHQCMTPPPPPPKPKARLDVPDFPHKFRVKTRSGFQKSALTRVSEMSSGHDVGPTRRPRNCSVKVWPLIGFARREGGDGKTMVTWYVLWPSTWTNGKRSVGGHLVLVPQGVAHLDPVCGTRHPDYPCFLENESRLQYFYFSRFPRVLEGQYYFQLDI